MLGSLMRRLDFKHAREKQAIDQLLEIAEDWQRSYHRKWDEWRRELAARGTAKQRFQSQALQALLYNCRFIPDEARAMIWPKLSPSRSRLISSVVCTYRTCFFCVTAYSGGRAT